MGFVSIIFLNFMSIEHPIGILYNGESNFEAFINEWGLSTFYSFSIFFIIIGVVLFMVEPMINLIKLIKAKSL